MVALHDKSKSERASFEGKDVGTVYAWMQVARLIETRLVEAAPR